MNNPFIHSQGKILVDSTGNEVFLRGIGLGGWLLPEGYMWKFPQEGDRPRKIEAYFNKCLGYDKAKVFWETYTQNFITLKDIQAIKQEGFNSIRIPLHCRFLLNKKNENIESHWDLLDRVIEWCEAERLYVILDLHGAPGGQTGSNIDDSEQDQPELFTKRSNQILTIKLWEDLAQRYKDKEIIACYDLLNEPLPNWFSKHNPKLISFYKELIVAIRKIDPYHMISLEGSHWATEWDIFEEPWDNNVLYQFHKYWNNPDQASLQRYLDFREKWDVPLFMGEGGENNKEWYTGTFPLLEDFNISYNFWTYKKMETTNSPYSIQMPKDWHILSQAIAQSEFLESETLEEILKEYLENIKVENCTYFPNVAHSIFRIPPLVIPAVFYQKVELSSHHSLRTNVGFRAEDKVEIRFLDSQRTVPNFNHGQGQAWDKEDWLVLRCFEGDRISYRVKTKHKQEYIVCVELITECISTLEVKLGTQIKSFQIMDLNRKTLTIGSFLFEQGDNELEIKVRTGRIKLICINVK
jgi:endoglucanase